MCKAEAKEGSRNAGAFYSVEIRSKGKKLHGGFPNCEVLDPSGVMGISGVG